MATAIFDDVAEDGRVRLVPSTTLSERAKVYVVVPDPAPRTRPTVHLPGPRLASPEDARRLAKQVIELGEGVSHCCGY